MLLLGGGGDMLDGVLIENEVVEEASRGIGMNVSFLK